MKKRWMISIGVVAIAVGIGAAIWVPDYLEIKKAQAVVEKNLNDPDSAIFRNAVVARESIPDKGIEYVYVCGEVNAKNRMGGYVGYKHFYWDSDEKKAVGPLDDRQLGAIMEDLARRTCAKLS